MIQAGIILLALILGYFINLPWVSNQWMNRLLNLIIALIIFVMGYNFGELALSLKGELLAMAGIVIAFILGLFIVNITAIKAFLYLKPHRRVYPSEGLLQQKSPLIPILISFKYLVYLIIGVFLGIIIDTKLGALEFIIDALLVITLFIIGMQLQREGHSLTQVLKNKTGFSIAIVLIISSLIIGALLGLIFHIPIPYALMMSSGFGWYSLSSILNAQLLDAHFGTMTFFIDFPREIFAIILIPSFAKQMPTEFIGYSGATAMDFTLPVIKDNIGMQAVPVAISIGFILTIATPILIPLLNLLNH
ncbi:lysine exporter LysO family protein [Facilibium subflavum]|uniref:lysine exporter LysO family protein n=1 Tax=Facilibium subflavum TaxID=2219058 RepID=UPI000E65D52D|nr:LysO family transporter [Facilibium subflavum]